MSTTLASPQALALLDRRRFFGDTTRGLGAMALASLLDADGRLERGHRPSTRPGRPHPERDIIRHVPGTLSSSSVPGPSARSIRSTTSPS
ncbi:MAG: hypothetical protein Ct9H300mP1_13340 [Planctomycetaceae bacterium]|nr:MAG: hypothetical protein Ct9H300mP1_13340 [Planctomycetaceae bacterium]